jgi:2-C-methyl-D-erythritol 4-phosphate cytidylyltransferase/2-C-methyl-D-erythritol 2,4-cyclodiphosphate synthase
MLTVTQKATGLRLVLTYVLVHLLLLFHGIYKTGKKVFNFMGSGHCFAIYKKTLLEHTIDAFKSFPEIKKTIIVYNKKHRKFLDKISLNQKLKIIGGKSRQESTFIALKKLKKMRCSKVIIHDAARPNPSNKIIANIISLVKKNHAVVPVIKITDATKRVEKNKVFKNIKRNTLRLSQTPQGFTYKKIYEKHLKNIKKSFDDDVSLFTNDNEKVITIEGSKKNLKITDKEDLDIFKSLKKKKTYVGIGFDVHKLIPKRKLFLAGIKIRSKLGTLGHSDGDPVLHAIIDGILGACRMGDIG